MINHKIRFKVYHSFIETNKEIIQVKDNLLEKYFESSSTGFIDINDLAEEDNGLQEYNKKIFEIESWQIQYDKYREDIINRIKFNPSITDNMFLNDVQEQSKFYLNKIKDIK